MQSQLMHQMDDITLIRVRESFLKPLMMRFDGGVNSIRPLLLPIRSGLIRKFGISTQIGTR